MASILIVDDDPIFVAQMGLFMERLGHRHAAAGSFWQGLAAAEECEADVVLLDVHLPDASGLDGLARFKQTRSQPEIVIVTGRSDPDAVDQAIRKGAWDYLEKPPSLDTIRLVVGRALAYRKSRLDQGAALVLERDAIIGNSPVLKQSLLDLARAAKGLGNVLITGETGTGKELFAKALHANSPRRDKPFVVVDCTNIPETLAESILFGHVRGAFTDAVREREGMFALAHGGTMFFDEVGDLSESLQRSLLRVIQERRFRPIGASRERDSDFRLVAVTNRDVRALVEAGRFRQDLYFRLSQTQIHLPPLREREGDVELLTTHFLARLCSEQGIHGKAASREFSDCLRRHSWPGNVRELLNALASAVANTGDEPILHPHHLPADLRAHSIKSGLSRPAEAPAPDGPALEGPALEARPAEPGRLQSLREFRDSAFGELEARYLDRLLAVSGGDVGLALSQIGRASCRERV